MKEPVQDGRGAGHVAQEFAPLVNRSVAGHDGGAVFVAPHDDFQEILPGMPGQGFESHVVNDDQFGFEVFAHGAFLLAEGFVFQKVPDQVEDGTVEHVEVHLDGFVADGLGQVGFADTRRPHKEDIGGLANEGAGSQLVDVFAVDGGVEVPVEVLQCFEMVELGELDQTFQLALLAHGQFILANEFQEVGMAQAIGRRLL